MSDQEVQPKAEPATVVVYKDDDLVYVDPDARTVVGRVEWSNAGRPKQLAMKNDAPVDEEEGDAKDKRRRPRKQRYYPWGTYRSMKRVYKLEGKPPREESQKTLDDVIVKALSEPFWD